MTWIEQLIQIEERLEKAFSHNRMDTFKILLSERIYLLKKARFAADGREVFLLARSQSERWEILLSERSEALRRQQVKMRSTGSYGATRRSGKLFNRSM